MQPGEMIMTEREKDLLQDLLKTPTDEVETRMGEAHAVRIDHIPDELTPRDERELLRLTRDIGPVTLSADQPAPETTPTSFAQDIGNIVRRYPIPTAIAVAGATYLFARRKR